MTRKNLLTASVVLVVLAVLSVLFVNPKRPEAVCAMDQLNTSGFFDSGKNCYTTIESQKKINDYEASPKLGTIGALVLGVAAVTTTVIGLKKPKS